MIEIKLLKTKSFFLLNVVLLWSCWSLALYAQESQISEALNIGASEQPGVHDVNGPHYARWQDLKRAVCVVCSQGESSGTGFLINTVQNTNRGGQRKLFLVTAAHVVNLEDEDNAIDLFLSFDYESIPIIGDSEDDNLNLLPPIKRVYKIPFIRRVVDELSDLALLEVDLAKIRSDPNWSRTNGDPFHPNSPFYNAYALGWNLHANLQKNNYWNIHHSDGDSKKGVRGEQDLSGLKLHSGTSTDDMSPDILGSKLFFQASFPAAELASEGASGAPLINRLDSAVVAVLNAGVGTANRLSLFENSIRA